MKAGRWISVGILITLGVVVLGLTAGWLWWRFVYVRLPVYSAPRGGSPLLNSEVCDDSRSDIRTGMMGGVWQKQCVDGPYSKPGMTGAGDYPVNCVVNQDNDQAVCPGSVYQLPGDLSGQKLSINDAYESVEQYITDLDIEGLEIAEIMEFEANFYAIVNEVNTGIGAMELLVDKRWGTVSPEMGPNMMWNAKYGVHQDMMGWGNNQENTLSPDAVLNLAQNWLDANIPGATTDGHADAFYGYYTIHTINDDEIEGMLSVHAGTGQIWYHTWHGAFVQMVEGDGAHLDTQ